MSKEIFDKYVNELKTKQKINSKSQKWELVNPWAAKKTADWFEYCWNKIVASGLQFDGKHITLNENGVSYDYVAYKNKMFLAYPESKIDDGLVYKGDTFSFEKENGVVSYHHKLANPFDHKEEDIIGGYCVIKNKRGEFITTLSRDEISKARRVAKTQTIWQSWFAEMCKKTIIKKAVKFHFDDVYSEMEEEDNKNYDLDKALPPADELPEAVINAINAAEDMKALTTIFNREYKNFETAVMKEQFTKCCTARKLELQAMKGKNNANS